jgi:hypothetical protein
MRWFGAAFVGAALLLPATAKADILVNISKSQQRMAVSVDGSELYRWPVSTGRRHFPTPSGAFHPTRLERHWYSRQYELTPMPWSMFFFRGYAVHGTMEAYNLGRAASHGCVRLRPDHAATLFSLMHKRKLAETKIVVMDGPLPAPPRAVPMADAGAPKAETVAAAQPAKVVSQSDVAGPAKPHRDLAEAAQPQRADVATAALARAQAPRPRLAVARGDDAAVLRSRQAWLDGLAHKYGFNRW